MYLICNSKGKNLDNTIFFFISWKHYSLVSDFSNVVFQVTGKSWMNWVHLLLLQNPGPVSSGQSHRMFYYFACFHVPKSRDLLRNVARWTKRNIMANGFTPTQTENISVMVFFSIIFCTNYTKSNNKITLNRLSLEFSQF